MYHLIKVLWQYVVCVINWNNKNSLMLIWTLNYYTYCYIIVSTIFVIKFDSHIFFFFFQGMCKTKNRRTCTWIHWYVNEAVPVLVLILIIIFSLDKGGYSSPLVGRSSVVQVHACIPFLLWSHGEYTFICIFKNSSFPLFFIRWSTRVFSF